MTITDADYAAWSAAPKLQVWFIPATGDEWKQFIIAKLALANASVDDCNLIVKPAPTSCGGPDVKIAYVTGNDRDGVPFVMVL